MSRITNTIASDLAAWFSGMSGVVASAVPVDTIPNTPYAVVAGPKGQLIPASWEQRTYRFTVHYLVARTTDESRTQTALNDALDDVIDHIRLQGITLGGVVTSALLSSFDTEKFYAIGTEQYQAIDFDFDIEVYAGETWIP